MDKRIGLGKRTLVGALYESWARKTGVRRYIGPKRAMALLLPILVAVGWYLRKSEILDPTIIVRLLDAHPVAGPVLFVVCYGAAVLTALPTVPFNLAAGFFWGPIAGGVLSAIGTTVGAIAAFAMSRFVFGRPLAGRFDSKLVVQIQQEFEAKSWKFVAFMRLNPIFPTGALNYVLGLTSISTFTYSWVTFVFLLPASILVAYIGNSMGTFVVTTDVASILKLVLVASTSGTLLVGLAYGARFYGRIHPSTQSHVAGSDGRPLAASSENVADKLVVNMRATDFRQP